MKDDYWEPHYYRWIETNPDTGKYLWAVDMDHQRDVIDRYEYNEQYNVRSVKRYLENDKEIWLGEMYKYAQFYINDEVFAKPCDEQCGGLASNGEEPSVPENRLIECNCNNYTHAAYQLREWLERYGYGYRCLLARDTTCKYWIRLDETDKPIDIKGDGKYDVHNNYAQLYIPYETFKAACRQIKTVYSANPVGYFNYMRYWAKNGNHTQICNYTENAGDPYGTTRVINTYLVSNFWNSYDGTKDPVTGQAWKDENGNVEEGKKAIGWL